MNKIEGKRIEITDTIAVNIEVESFIIPYRCHIEKNLDSVLTYASDTYTRTKGKLNTAIGNFMADAVFNQTNPFFKKRTGHDIDMVLLNYGSIRSIYF